MKNLMTILALGLCLILSPSLQAQDEGPISKSEAIVYLKGGTKVRGEIKEWKYDEYILLIMPWGGELGFTNDQIKNVVQIGALEKQSAIYNFKEKGMYITAKAQLISGNEGPRAKGVFGVGFSASIGHRFNRFLGIGGGIGYDKFIWESGENLIPVFAEINGFLTPTNTSLFYNLQVGYSFAQANDAYLLTEAKGGLLIYPSVGIRFGKEDTKMTLDLGYKFQNATFTYEDIWTRTTNSEQDVLFKRLSLRIGIYL
jgi:hypothetical protein